MIRLSNSGWRFLLSNMLSIKVALVLLILVGLVIVGNKFRSKMHSRNSRVLGCLDCLSKSKLWSSPIMHSCFMLFILFI